MGEGEIDNLTMEQYLALTRGNQAPGVVKPEIRGNVNFELKSTVHHQRLPSSLKKSATSSRKETRHYTKLGSGPIPGMTPTQALTAIQTMADHSQKWLDGSFSKNKESSSNFEGIAVIVNKLENLSRDMKKLKENVHAIQVGCQICGGGHLDKDFPLNEEVKSVKEPSSGERRPSLTKIINKYMEEESKRHAKQDEWLKKFYQSTETSREAHDKIIQGLETKVRTLSNEVEGRANNRKFEEYKKICTEDGSPLYTPFYYYSEEIEYFSANSGFLDDEKQETDNSRMAEALAALEAHLRKNEVPKRRRNSKVDLRMPIILGRPLLATAHAKVDILRKSISLEVGSEKVILKMGSSFTTTNFESVRSIKSETCLEDDDLKKIDYDLFLYDSESSPQEKRVHWCKAILQEKENERQYWASCNPNSNVCDGGDVPINVENICDGGDVPINVEKHYWESINDSKREELEWENLSLNDWMKIRYGKVCKMTKERILKDHWRERFGDEEDDLEENLEDPEECREDKANAITRAIHDTSNDDWFNNTSEDEDDLEGILDYLEPRTYDGFIDFDDEAYNKRRSKLLGMIYEEPTPILIKKVKVTRYTIGPGEIYTKVKVLGVDEIPRTRDNVATIRAILTEKMAHEGNGQAKT
ncbi:hypothetical protein Tco_1014764 [Tanacetum coccineum]